MSTSIDTSTPNQNDDTSNRGEELYQQAMSALTKASKAKQKHEEQLLKEQFEAMEKQRIKTQQRQVNRNSNNDPRLQRLNDIDAQSTKDDGEGGGINDRAAGVAVVRTIVKQSNAKRDDIIQKQIHVEQSSAAKANNEEESEEHYQKLSQQYLEEAAFRYSHPLALVRLGNEALIKNSNNDDTTKPLFDTERMTSWILESPIKLGAALAFIKGESYNVLALQLYQEAGKQGSSEGWYNFGHMLWEGGVVSDDVSWSDGASDKEKAIDAFHKAIELQDSDAMYFVAAQYLNYDEEEGGDENGNNVLLAKCYELYGSEFLSKLKADGLENEWDTFMEESIQPSDESNNALDLSLQTTQRADSQLESFSNIYHQYGYALLQYAAFGYEHGPALHHLALLHNQNDDIQTFHQILTKAASTGNPDSLFLQGHCYYTGSDGHNKNIPLALENFLAASESQHVDAMVSAGAILHQGVVSDDDNGRRTVIIQRDQQRAFELYQQAGELGSIEGWRNVVSCYATGQGVPKCIDTAKYIAKTMLRD